MGCIRSKLAEIPWCEPIKSFGWLGSRSSRLVGERTYPWYCLHTYIRANSVWWETAQENDRYHLTPKQWTTYWPWFWPIKRYSYADMHRTVCKGFSFAHHLDFFICASVLWNCVFVVQICRYTYNMTIFLFARAEDLSVVQIKPLSV